jgi:hypothetical protein
VLPLIDPSEESVKVRAAPKRARKTNLGDTIKFWDSRLSHLYYLFT